MKPIKPKKCKQCEVVFVPFRSMQKVCSPICAAKQAREDRWKAFNKLANKERKEGKERLKTHKDYLKDLQRVFNTFIRIRDQKMPCVSCGVYLCEEFHAGHFIPTTKQFLRFHEFNVWKQCSKCNTHLRGNSIPYRIELIRRIGLGEVEKLEDDMYKELDLSIPEIKEMIVLYKSKTKLLKQAA